MADGNRSSRRRWVALSVLLTRLGRSPELTKLLLLLLVWGHVRARAGHTTLEVQSGPKPARQASVPKGKGFSIKRPRQRFL
ncbi:MAG: hypothetical protein R3300_01995 [Candidatus Promineifilaceae bacterium]|nr:hypothetical protein [Candidatus Promineifilaceae bacterium]